MDKVNFLKTMKGRAKVLCSSNASLEKVFDDAIKHISANPDSDAEFAKQIIAAKGNPELQNALNALRVTTVNNFVRANSNALAFFNQVELKDDEIPYIENTTQQEVKVDYLGQDGKAKSMQVTREQDQSRVDLFSLSSEDVEYRILDIYRGNIKSPSLANVDVSYDLSQKIDTLLWPYIASRIGDFTTTGKKANRVYVPHSAVKTANLPTTNLLTPASGNSTTSKFRKACMDLVIKYCASWGSNAFRDGELKPQVVFIPSIDLSNFLDEISSIGTEANLYTEQIFDAGYVMRYGGVNWTFIGDNTLDPAAGLAYVKLNKSIGDFFHKPGMDDVMIDDSKALRKQNKESMSMKKVIGAGLPSFHKVNVAAVRYRTAA